MSTDPGVRTVDGRSHIVAGARVQWNDPMGDWSLVLMEDLTRSLLKLRLVRISEGLQQLRFLQEEMQQESGAAGLNPYQEIIMQYAQTRSRLDQALGKPQMGDQAA